MPARSRAYRRLTLVEIRALYPSLTAMHFLLEIQPCLLTYIQDGAARNKFIEPPFFPDSQC